MRAWLPAVIAFGLLSSCFSEVEAQSYPSKPIRIVVPVAPGGANDMLARAFGQRLAEAWGTAVVVENKPGGNTQLAAEYVSRATPDGHTLLSSAERTFVVNPFLYGKLSYDPVKGFVPVSGLGVINQILAVHPSFTAQTMQELIAHAKAHPGRLTYATNGPGSAPHLNMELLQHMAAISLVPVHYRGGAPSLADLIGGHLQIGLLSVGLVEQPWKAGQLRALGVGSKERLAQFPALPTIAESGVPGFSAASWFGLFAPAGTPQEIVLKLNTEAHRILNDTTFRERFLGPNFIEPIAGSPEQFASYVRTEAAKWSGVIREANIRAE